jgi:glycosyltransferase involved in cell wall biosynthesis
MGGRSWDDEAERVVVHTSHYLDFDGTERRGGRARLLTELIWLMREAWGRPVVVVQKGERDFETVDGDGVPVIGLKAPLTSAGDAVLGRRVRSLLRRGDVVFYGAGAQGAFPFHVDGAKGVQHGIGWDGPYSPVHRRYHALVNVAFARAARSILCVDTNFGNWLRMRGERGLELAAKCVYVPNFADIDRIPTGPLDRAPGDPLRLVWARRNERKRGPELFLDALVALRSQGVRFEAAMYAVGRHAELRGAIAARGLTERVDVREAGMEEILSAYQHFDVAVVPTLWSEGTSLACVEALCAGVPAVVTPVGGLGNLVIPGFNGEVVPPDAAALAGAIAGYVDEDRWRAQRAACLSLRPTFSLESWRARVLPWLRS